MIKKLTSSMLVSICSLSYADISHNGWDYISNKIGAKYDYLSKGYDNGSSKASFQDKGSKIFVNCKENKKKCIRVINLSENHKSNISYSAAKYVPEGRNIKLEYDNANFKISPLMNEDVLPKNIIFDKEKEEDSTVINSNKIDIKMHSKTKYLKVPALKIGEITYNNCIEKIVNSSTKDLSVVQKQFYCKGIGLVRHIEEFSRKNDENGYVEGNLMSITYPFDATKG